MTEKEETIAVSLTKEEYERLGMAALHSDEGIGGILADAIKCVVTALRVREDTGGKYGDVFVTTEHGPMKIKVVQSEGMIGDINTTRDVQKSRIIAFPPERITKIW